MNSTRNGPGSSIGGQQDGNPTGVVFGEVFRSTLPTSDRAVEVGQSVNIPMPSRDWGLLEAAYWWGVYVGKVFPAFPASKLPNSNICPKGTQDTYGSRDVEQIKSWWLEERWSNVCVPTRANGLLVIDVDPRNGGIDSIHDWTREIGVDLEDVPRDTSPSGDGGCHLWWRLPADAPVIKCGEILDGVDIPWQVPVPPSLRRPKVGVDSHGNDILSSTPAPYVWTAGDPRDLPIAPEALLRSIEDLGGVKGTTRRRKGKGRAPVSEKYTSDATIDVEKLLETGIPVGRQNIETHRTACSLARRGIAREHARELLVEVLRVSPVGRSGQPWTTGQIVGMVDRAYDFIDADNAEQDRRNAAALQGLLNGMRGTDVYA